MELLLGDLDPKLLNLRRERNSIGLGDYDHYLHDGSRELVTRSMTSGVSLLPEFLVLLLGLPVLLRVFLFCGGHPLRGLLYSTRPTVSLRTLSAQEGLGKF